MSIIKGLRPTGSHVQPTQYEAEIFTWTCAIDMCHRHAAAEHASICGMDMWHQSHVPRTRRLSDGCLVERPSSRRSRPTSASILGTDQTSGLTCMRIDMCAELFKRHVCRHAHRHVHRHAHRHAQRHVHRHACRHVCRHMHTDTCMGMRAGVDVDMCTRTSVQYASRSSCTARNSDTLADGGGVSDRG